MFLKREDDMKAEYFFFLLSLLGHLIPKAVRRPSLALVLKREDDMKADYFILSIVTSRSSHSEGCEGRVRDGKEKFAL